MTVSGVVWYSGESWTGTAIGETSTNGACVTVSALDLGFTPASLALYSVDDAVTTIDLYTGSNCTGYGVQPLHGRRQRPRHQPRHRRHRLGPRLLQDHLVTPCRGLHRPGAGEQRLGRHVGHHGVGRVRASLNVGPAAPG